jgi:hypothetical protein
MKKPLSALFLCIFIIISIAFILNIGVSTRRCVNYKCASLKIPLYLKVLDFFDRHYNYKQLVKNIISVKDGNEERAIKIFAWVCGNIRKSPQGLPVIDDHVWYIIVRGYGASDQFHDVFTTLCNYAGVDAFFAFIPAKGRAAKIPLSFVRINKRWAVFDPYSGVYFKNSSGEIASVEQIMAGDWAVFNFAAANKQNSDYAAYLGDLGPVGNIGLNRANTQLPLKRLMLELKKRFKKD